MSEVSPINKFIQTVGVMALPRVAIFAALLTGAYYMWIYNDGSAITQSIQTSRNNLGIENNKKVETKKVLEKEQQMKADVEIFAKKFEEIKNQIPIEFTETELRGIVDRSSLKYNLATTKSDRRPQDPPVIRADNKAEVRLVDQIGLNYEFQGSYSNIAKFVREISSMEKLIKIGNFKLDHQPIKNNKKPSSKDVASALTFRVTIIGFKQSLEAMKPAATAGVQK